MTVAIYSGIIPSTSFIERLILGLAQNGVEVKLFGTLGANEKYNSPYIHVIGNKSGALGLLEGVCRIFILMLWKRYRYRKLREHLECAPFSNFPSLMLWKKYTPIVLYLPDVFHVQWAKSAADWVFLKELFGVRLVLSLRGAHINYSPLSNSALAQMYRVVFPKYDRFHGVSKAIIEESIKYGVSREKSQTIYSGLSITEDLLIDLARSEELRLLTVGRFHWKKGYNYLFDALLLLKNTDVKFTLTLVAQGDMPEEIKFQINELDLSDNIIWIKGLEFKEVLQQMKDHDLLVLPSVEEGIANVVLEAMNVGLPVLSTNCGGMSEVICNDINGFLIDVRDSNAIADKIAYFKNLNSAEKRKIILQAHQTIKDNFDISINSTQFLNLYREGC